MNIKRFMNKLISRKEKEQKRYQKERNNEMINIIAQKIVESMSEGKYYCIKNIRYYDADVIVKHFSKKGYICSLDDDRLKVSWEHVKDKKTRKISKAIVFDIFMSLFAIFFIVGFILTLKVGVCFEINNKSLITCALVSFGIAFVSFLIAMFIDIFWEEKK